MRIVLQRVKRASVEMNGVSEHRIGLGLVATLAVNKGDTAEAAKNLASKILHLKLWPELMDPETSSCSTLAENGYEILVLLEPTLNAVFPKYVPEIEGSPDQTRTKVIFEAFMNQLREEYQEEMIVGVECDSHDTVVEKVCIGGSIYQFGGIGASGMGAAKRVPPKANVAETPGMNTSSAPALAVVTKALQRLPKLAKGRGAAETDRVVRILKLPKFRAAFAEAESDEMDEFAEALDSAAHVFSAKQQETIKELTGLQISGSQPVPLGDEIKEGADFSDKGEIAGDDDLEKQLAELNNEIIDKHKGIAASKRRRAGIDVKMESKQDTDDADRVRPDVAGKAAPETPAAISAREWAANRRAQRQMPQLPWNSHGKGGGKGGKGHRQQRSWGIVSVDESARLHGQKAGTHYGGEQANKRRALSSLPKGTPTVAPMCPDAVNETEVL